jgi:hypothetical protein
VKGKRFSEIKNCSVFGLRLGMTFNEAKQIIDQSGYFPENVSLTKVKGCHSDNEACVGYVFTTKDGFSISVEFDPSFEGDEAQLRSRKSHCGLILGQIFEDLDLRKAVSWGRQDRCETWPGSCSRTNSCLQRSFRIYPLSLGEGPPHLLSLVEYLTGSSGFR